MKDKELRRALSDAGMIYKSQALTTSEFDGAFIWARENCKAFAINLGWLQKIKASQP